MLYFVAVEDTNDKNEAANYNEEDTYDKKQRPAGFFGADAHDKQSICYRS